jgi:hypothetical protein
VAEGSAGELRGPSDGCAGIRPALDFSPHISLREDKPPLFKTIREELRTNPGRAYAFGDEK